GSPRRVAARASGPRAGPRRRQAPSRGRSSSEPLRAAFSEERTRSGVGVSSAEVRRSRVPPHRAPPPPRSTVPSLIGRPRSAARRQSPLGTFWRTIMTKSRNTMTWTRVALPALALAVLLAAGCMSTGGKDGKDGKTGATGRTGDTGAAGEDGANGTSKTVIYDNR